MAVSKRVASRYARSIIGLAEERKVLEEIKNDFSAFLKVSSDSSDFRIFLKSPIISHHKKQAILESIFSGKVNELTLSFFKLITGKNREADLIGIAKEVINQYNHKQGIQEATITTTIPLSDELRGKVTSIVNKATGMKDVRLQENVNEELIAGYVLRVEDKQIDSSVKTLLNKAKNHLNKK